MRNLAHRIVDFAGGNAQPTMAEDEAAVAADAVQVTEVGEKTDGAVAVETKEEFQPEVLAWLKRFKLEGPEMLEHLKKLNAYKVRMRKTKVLGHSFGVESPRSWQRGSAEAACLRYSNMRSRDASRRAASTSSHNIWRHISEVKTSGESGHELLRIYGVERPHRRPFLGASVHHSRDQRFDCGTDPTVAATPLLTAPGAPCVCDSQIADLAKVTEAQIASLGLKPAAQARFREGVSAVQAEQKPKTPTKVRGSVPAHRFHAVHLPPRAVLQPRQGTAAGKGLHACDRRLRTRGGSRANNRPSRRRYVCPPRPLFVWYPAAFSAPSSAVERYRICLLSAHIFLVVFVHPKLPIAHRRSARSKRLPLPLHSRRSARRCEPAAAS